MIHWRQVRPRCLWFVSTFVQLTNSRALTGHLIGTNPARVPEGITRAIFHLRMQVADRALTQWRVYGSMVNGAFPPVATAGEVLASAAPGASTTASTGRIRQPQTPNANAAKAWAMYPLPRWLLLEFSSGAIAFGTLECNFRVDVTWLAPPYVGTG